MNRYKADLKPSLFTLLNLTLGFMSIVRILEEDFIMSAWFIVLAVLADGLDGKIARWTNSSSAFGVELDSLADFSSFGLAPALLGYSYVFKHYGVLGWILVLLYLFGGIFRLARFNVVQNGDRSQGYIGLPIPVAAMTFVSAIFINLDPESVLWTFLIVILTLLMISRIPYDWPKWIWGPSFKQFLHGSALLSGLILIALFPETSLLPVLLIYILSGIIRWIRAIDPGELTLTKIFKINEIKSYWR